MATRKATRKASIRRLLVERDDLVTSSIEAKEENKRILVMVSDENATSVEKDYASQSLTTLKISKNETWYKRAGNKKATIERKLNSNNPDVVVLVSTLRTVIEDSLISVVVFFDHLSDTKMKHILDALKEQEITLVYPETLEEQVLMYCATSSETDRQSIVTEMILDSIHLIQRRLEDTDDSNPHKKKFEEVYQALLDKHDVTQKK